MPNLTKSEKKLFKAIVQKKVALTRKLIKVEEASVLDGNPPQTRPTVQDDDGDTVCHVTSKCGVRAIIDCVLWSSINFAYNIPNSSKQLPADISWNDIFKNSLPYRIDQDKKAQRTHDLLQSYSITRDAIIQQEQEIHGYKKGIIFTSDFTLHRKSTKNSDKDCIIFDKVEENDEFSIHDRQALDEAVITNQKILNQIDCWQELPRSLSAQNYLLANIGFVIGNDPYVKPSLIKRVFYSIPIYFPKKMADTLKFSHRDKTSGHSEINLYDLLLTPGYFQYILARFRKALDVPEGERRKIYNCIIDTHSSQDMCDGCELDTYPFQDQLVNLIKSIAATNHFLISKSCSVIIRASSSRAPSYTEYRKPHHERQAHLQYGDFFARTYTHDTPIDVKKSENFILHYDENTREMRGAGWYKKSKLLGTTMKDISSRTLFFVTKTERPYRNPAFPNDYEINNDADLLQLKF
ncbi:MAG: hypothetical protein K2Q14_06620 [Gammaproteobacteria bacterium]|nr:hypothetical protein [Gammaproteobacteria bacterium]